MQNRFSSLRRSLAGSASLLAMAFWSHAGYANPVDGVVEAGTADISTPSPGTVVINQTSKKAIINWGSFDIGTGELTQFVLPESTSVTLNRDFSGNPSEILGAIKSNGHFYLINPSGILFGTGSKVDVAGLVATTHNIRSDDFLNGDLNFNIAGDPAASVINQGNVTIEDVGIAAFVAPHVRNDGAILAHMGKVELASANGFTLDLYGDRLVSFLIENPNNLSYGTDGQAVSALVENSGTIIADGGQVVLSAAAARGVVDSVINTDGVIQANSVAQRGGKIILGGGSAGTVKVSGKVKARGNKAGEKGGEIIVTGTVLTADQYADFDVSGWAGGGKLLFGGDYLGGNATNDQVARFHFTMEDKSIQTASVAVLQEGAKLSADALVDGNGGKIVVWADDATVTAADISARGGSVSGNGGFIETSGSYLQVEKAADASAANGTDGTWLLDPLDITIDRSGTNNLWTYNPSEFFSLYQGGGFNAISARPFASGSVLSANTIESALNSGSNVVVTTYGTSGSGAGNIRLKTDITKTSGGSNRFSLLAANNITVDPGVDVRSFAGSMIFEVSAAFGSIAGSNVGQIALKGAELLLVAQKGIQFSSQFDMPDHLSVLLNNTSIGSSPRQVHVTFGQDIVRFNYSSTNLDLFSGAISLLDSSATGSLHVGFAQPVNARLYDRSIVTNTNRKWNIGPTVSAAAAASSALNGIPEIEGFQNPFWSFGVEPGPGYIPVIEVSALRDGTADRGMHIVTAPSGYAALSAYLTQPQAQLPVVQVANQAVNPNIDLQAAMAGVQQLPGLSCEMNALMCKAVAPTVGLPLKRGKDAQILVSSPVKTGNLASGEIKGTLAILVAGQRIELTSKSNGASEGTVNGEFQCVSLIKDYANKVSGLALSTKLGYGLDVAGNLARAAPSKFTYEVAKNSSFAPTVGSVISMNGVSGSELDGVGHVGIVQSEPSAEQLASGKFDVTLFDQNWPTSVSGAWKTVTFIRAPDGTWSGYMLSNEKEMPVTGWANLK